MRAQFHDCMDAQAEDASACCSSAASVEAFPTQIRAGAVWVWPDSSATAAVDSSLAHPSIDTVLEVCCETLPDFNSSVAFHIASESS